jgi:hypothetical protein
MACYLRGMRGTYGIGLALVALLRVLVARGAAPLCVAGVVLMSFLGYLVSEGLQQKLHAFGRWFDLVS